MARLRAFGARAFRARTFNPVWGIPAVAHSGAVRVDFVPKKREPPKNDHELVIMLVCKAFIYMVNHGD